MSTLLDSVSLVVALDALQSLCLQIDKTVLDAEPAVKMMCDLLMTSDDEYLVSKTLEVLESLADNPALHSIIITHGLEVISDFLECKEHLLNPFVDSPAVVSLALSLLHKLVFASESTAALLLPGGCMLERVMAFIDAPDMSSSQVKAVCKRVVGGTGADSSLVSSYRLLLQLAEYPNLRAAMLESGTLAFAVRRLLSDSGFPIYFSAVEYANTLSISQLREHFKDEVCLPLQIRLIFLLSHSRRREVVSTFGLDFQSLMAFVTYYAHLSPPLSPSGQDAVGLIGQLASHEKALLGFQNPPWCYIDREQMVNCTCDLILFTDFLKNEEESWLGVKASAAACLSRFVTIPDDEVDPSLRDAFLPRCKSVADMLESLCTRSFPIFRCYFGTFPEALVFFTIPDLLYMYSIDLFFMEGSTVTLTTTVMHSALFNLNSADEDTGHLAALFLYRISQRDEAQSSFIRKLPVITLNTSLRSLGALLSKSTARAMQSTEISESQQQMSAAMTAMLERIQGEASLMLFFTDDLLSRGESFSSAHCEHIKKVFEGISILLTKSELSTYQESLWLLITSRTSSREYAECIISSPSFDAIIICIKTGAVYLNEHIGLASSPKSVVVESNVKQAVSAVTGLCVCGEDLLGEKILESGICSVAVDLLRAMPSPPVVRLLLILSNGLHDYEKMAESPGFLQQAAKHAAQVPSETDATALMCNIFRTSHSQSEWRTILPELQKLAEALVDVTEPRALYHLLSVLRLTVRLALGDDESKAQLENPLDPVRRLLCAITLNCLLITASSSQLDLNCIDYSLSILVLTTNQPCCRDILVDKRGLYLLRSSLSRLIPTDADLLAPEDSSTPSQSSLLRSSGCDKCLRILQFLVKSRNHVGLLKDENCVLLDLMKVLVSSPRSLPWFPAVLTATDLIQVQ